MIDYRVVTPLAVQRFIGTAFETALDMAFAWMVWASKASSIMWSLVPKNQTIATDDEKEKT